MLPLFFVVLFLLIVLDMTPLTVDSTAQHAQQLISTCSVFLKMLRRSALSTQGDKSS